MLDNGQTDDDGRDDGPWLYYKLTNEPKGSGELITPYFQEVGGVTQHVMFYPRQEIF